jgi:hypothetical protein
MSYVSPFTGDVIQPTDVSYRGFTLSTDTTLSWPVNGNATGNYAARIMDVTASAGSLSLFMPPGNQTSVGTDSLIRNTGANSFTVKTSTGATILSIAAGEAQYIYLTDNSTVGGVWGIIAFGAGTSSADAATLQGYGLLAISSTLNQSHPASSIVNGATFADSDRAQAKVWSSGAGTIYLPAAASVGDNWFTLFKNNGTGTVIIDCNGAEFIDGELTKSFAPNESAFIICTGSEFITVGYGVSNLFVFTALVKPVVTGSYSLTPSEASNTIQEFVGTLTGDVTVTYPPTVNFYVISNQTVDNGYSLTLTTNVVGGANATIPPGQQATVICDGTNFLNANTTQAGATVVSLLNGTVGTPSLNFAAETSTGVYRPGSGQFAVSVLGTQRMNVVATGIQVTGTGTFSGGVSGGVFT